MEPDSGQDVPIIPVVRQPKGKAYFLGTWSGRLILINAFVFLYMIRLEPASILLPSQEFIRSFGTKSMTDIVLGEYWRFVTPVFVHIGVIHFFFNAMGIFYVGYQLEHILGKRYFLFLYLASGLIGNLASCLFSVSLSAGASGALFGLLGAGFKLEGVVSDAFDKAGFSVRPRKRIYSGMVVTNVILGLVIPVIDNAAHIGGLICGWLMIEALLRTRPNRLKSLSPLIAKLIYTSLVVFVTGTVAFSINPEIISDRFYSKALKATNAQESYYNLTEVIKIKPLHVLGRLQRGKLLLQNGELDLGIADVRMAMSTGKVQDTDLRAMIIDLEMTGHSLEAELVKRTVSEAQELK